MVSFPYPLSHSCSEKNQNNNLKAIIAFANFIGPDLSFYDIHSQDLCYLDTKIKNIEKDPEERWIKVGMIILTVSDLFFRWLTNKHISNKSDWRTPGFVQIKVEPSKLGHCINPEIGSVGFPLFYKDSAKDIIFRNQYPSLQLDMALVALSRLVLPRDTESNVTWGFG